MLTLSTVAGSRTSKPSRELTISDLTGKQGWIVIRSLNYAAVAPYARKDRMRFQSQARAREPHLSWAYALIVQSHLRVRIAFADAARRELTSHQPGGGT
jgi:hypothetical protein